MGEEKKGGQGIRYSAEQKQEVIDYLKANTERGSMKVAMEKFGISYLTARNWLIGGKSGMGSGKVGRPKKSASEGRSVPVKLPTLDHARFDKAQKIIEKIREAEIELRNLYATLQGLIHP